MSLIDDQEFEPVIREAMLARPQPGSISNLAYRAMELARLQTARFAQARIEFMARMRRRNWWVGIAASVMILVVVFAGVRKLSSAGVIGKISTIASTNVDSTGSDSSLLGATSSSGVITVGVELTALLLVVAMILLSTGIASSRPDFADIGLL